MHSLFSIIAIILTQKRQKVTKPKQELRLELWCKEHYKQLSKNIRDLSSLKCSASQNSSEAAELHSLNLKIYLNIHSDKYREN